MDASMKILPYLNNRAVVGAKLFCGNTDHRIMQAVCKTAAQEQSAHQLLRMVSAISHEAGYKRLALEQFRMQGSKSVDVIDVIPSWQKVDRKSDLRSAVARLPRDMLGAPRYVRK